MIAEAGSSRSSGETGTVDRENPWPGLASFREADHLFFQGRDEATADLLRRVQAERLTVLFSLSGLGKTSLVQAGLFPPLRAEGFLPIPVRLDFAGDSPELVAQVKAAFAREVDAAGIEAPPMQESETLWEYFHRPASELWRRNRLVIPVFAFDQFEEIFTLGRSRPELAPAREAFLAELADLVEGRPPAALQALLEEEPERAGGFDFQRHPYKILLTLREDYLAELEDLRDRMPSLSYNRMRLQRMNGEDALRVVAGAGEHLIGRDVAERVVRFVAGEGEEHDPTGRPVPLRELEVEPALLSVVCRELNNRRRARKEDRITADLLAVDRDAILSGLYEDSVAEVGAGMRRFVEERLLTPSGYRDSVALENALDLPDVTRAEVDLLIARRLLRIEERAGSARLELTHDVLTGVIRSSRDKRRQVEAQAKAEAAGREAEERERTIRRKLLRSRVTAALLLALLLAAVAGIGWGYGKKKESEQLLADAYYEKAGNSPANESLAYLAAILRLAPEHEQARALLHDILLVRRWYLPERTLTHPDGDVFTAMDLSKDGRFMVTGTKAGIVRLWDVETAEPLEVMRHKGGIEDARFSPDGRLVVTASLDGTARLWDARSGQLVGSMPHPPRVLRAYFSPDSRLVATRGDDNKVRLWDTEGRPVAAPISDCSIKKAAFSPDGRRILAACGEGVVRLWTVAGGQSSLLLRAEGWDHAEFSPGGGWIETIIKGEATLWDGWTGFQIQQPRYRRVWASTATFSPDERWLFIGGSQGEILAWDIQANQLAWDLQLQPPAAVENLRISSDGTRLLAMSARTVRLFNAGTGYEPAMPLAHSAGIEAADLTFDGRRVVSMSQDSVRIWDARVSAGGLPMRLKPGGLYTVLSADGRLGFTIWDEDKRPALQPWTMATGEALGPALALGSQPLRLTSFPSLSQDGRRVLAVLEDRLARLWDVRTGQPIGEPLQHGAPIDLDFFSLDGELAVTASRDGIVRLWDASTGREAGPPLRHKPPLTYAAMAPSSRIVALAGQDGIVQIWDVRTRSLLRTLPPLKSRGFATFGPDSRQLLTALEDGRMQLWDVQTGKPSGEPMVHERVNNAVFHSGGRLLATSSSDGTVRLWHLPAGTPMGAPLRLEVGVGYMRFSPDGERLVTVTSDNHAILWSTRTGERLGYRWVAQDAAFSPDGKQLILAQGDGAEIWDLKTGIQEDPEVLADLAEAVAGQTLSQGKLKPVPDPMSLFNDLRKRVGKKDSFARWFLQDPWQRTISPSSPMTVEQYLRKMLAADNPDVRTRLRQWFPSHPLLAPPPKPD